MIFYLPKDIIQYLLDLLEGDDFIYKEQALIQMLQDQVGQQKLKE